MQFKNPVLILLAWSGAMILRAAGPASHFAKLDGLRVHYESYGQGQTALVFIHGWTCDLTFWRLQIPAFEGKRRVLAVDLPGHGRSDQPEIAYTQDLFARAVEAMMRDAGVEKAILVGHSMGTPVARQFIRKYPDKALALAAVDAFPSVKGDPAGLARGYTAYANRFRGPDYKENASKFIDTMFSAQTGAALREEIKRKMLAAPQHVMSGAMQSMADVAIWKPDPIPVPALVILARSARVSAEQEQFLRTLIPNLDYQVWDGAGHFLMMEQPEKFNRTLEAFLTRNHL